MISKITLLFSTFSKKQNRQFYLLVLLMFIGAFLEAFGIALLLPLLAIITDENFLEKESFIRDFLFRLGINELNNLVFFVLGIYVLVNAFRIIFSGSILFKQTIFIRNFVVGLSEKLYEIYLKKPYKFHLNQNSAQLIRNMTGEVSIFAQLAQNFMTLFSESLVIGGILIFLLFLYPIGVISVACVLGPAVWAFYLISHKRISKWGIQRQYHEGMRLQELQSGLGGVKEIKLLGIEMLMIQNYSTYNRGSAHAFQRNSFVQNLPRLWLECLLIIGLTSFVLFFMNKGGPLLDLIPALGVFAAAAFRMMPSFNRIIQAIQGIGYGNPALQNLANEVSGYQEDLNIKSEPISEFKFSDSIEIKGLSFAYPMAKKPAIQNVNLTIKKGMSIGFIGGSGAGKSTLIDLLLGLLLPDKGEILVDGQNINDQIKCWQSELGYVPQSIYLTDETLTKNIAFGIPNENIDREAVLRAIQLAQLDDFVKSLPQGLDTKVGERGVRMSGGQRQRIGIARALYKDPSILLLDEATSALDQTTEKAFMHSIEKLHGNKTILIVAHRLTTVSNCDIVYNLNEGIITSSGQLQDIIE